MRTSGRAASLPLALLLVCCVARARGSAIPMWEFLTREEKMSHLYRVFGQEVAQYCADSTMPDCNKNLLVAGLKNLVDLSDDKLDEMDPYQRGAKDIIWRAVLGNNGQTASSLGQHSFHHTEQADPLAVGDNELTQESSSSHDYVQPADHGGPYLTGPMVIRVYPDGRPVGGDAKQALPKDEDADEIRLDTPLPLIHELELSKKAEQHELATEMLPPRKNPRAVLFRRLPAPAPAPWFFAPRLSRPNNLLIRERLY
ncbi:rhythmically expressed gene 5 protein [Phymastichus coffea]|uniref:rhythmically expressed gene 5 protein n=1 Tax=Phymastichus coffea TaxID=108790 RepID=UPI00273B4958|nr:rhythmically expressed gene 5 protein [Phymastichus coffea]